MKCSLLKDKTILNLMKYIIYQLIYCSNPWKILLQCSIIKYAIVKPLKGALEFHKG